MLVDCEGWKKNDGSMNVSQVHHSQLINLTTVTFVMKKVVYVALLYIVKHDLEFYLVTLCATSSVYYI